MTRGRSISGVCDAARQSSSRVTRTLGKPVLCAANGHVLAGALGLALACDLVIAKETATFGTPDYCDPNSDGTLIWRCWAIRTRNPRHRWLYGWIPARCPAALRP